MNKAFKRGAIIISGIALSLSLLGCGHHKTPEEKAEWITGKITKKLELDSEQQAKLSALSEQILNSRKIMHEKKQQHHEKLLTMIQNPTLDRDGLQAIVTDMTSRIEQQSPTIIQALGDFYDSLNDEQRAELREHLEEKLEDGHHRHHGW